MGALGRRRVKAGALVAALVCAVAGLAFAESDRSSVRFQPQWEREPPPTRAIFVSQKSVEGSVVLCCYPRRNRTLECRVGQEEPTTYAFGYHAMNLAYYYRLTRDSYVAYERGPHTPIELRYTFDVNVPGRGRIHTTQANYACPIGRVIVTD